MTHEAKPYYDTDLRRFILEYANFIIAKLKMQNLQEEDYMDVTPI